MLRGHGDDRYRYVNSVRADFSSNVPHRPEVVSFLRTKLAAGEWLEHYPEPDGERLAEAIAVREGVPPENVLITAGATAAIYLIAQAIHGARSAIIPPTFAEYEDASRIHAHALIWLGAIDQPSDATVMWINNPNNPTGTVWSRADLLALVDAAPQRLHVVDLAYADFCLERPVTAQDAAARENLLVIKSMAKRLGVPGLRLGHVVGAAKWIDRLKMQQAPWTVSGAANAAGRALVEDVGFANEFFGLGDDSKWFQPLDLVRSAEKLAKSLEAIPGIKSLASRTHFFLFRLDQSRSAQLKKWLVETHGLLVRDAANFRGLDGHYVRVASQGEEKNSWLAQALAQWAGRRKKAA